nr:hypothetical protein GCM10020093_074630 [Planobispora longispora]
MTGGVAGEAGRVRAPEQPEGRLGGDGERFHQSQRQVVRLGADAPFPEDRAQGVVQDDGLGVGDVEDTADGSPSRPVIGGRGGQQAGPDQVADGGQADALPPVADREQPPAPDRAEDPGSRVVSPGP